MKRKEILPKWIRFFAWLYLLSFIIPLFFIIGIFGEVSFNVFGLQYSGTSLHIIPIWATLLSTLAGVVAVGILWGKDWAISLGIPYAYLGILTNCIAFAMALAVGNINIPLDFILLIPFMITLNKNKEKWKYFNPEHKGGISNQRLHSIAADGSSE